MTDAEKAYWEWRELGDPTADRLKIFTAGFDAAIAHIQKSHTLCEKEPITRRALFFADEPLYREFK